MLHRVYIALGTNLGDRLKILQEAIAQLLPMVEPVSISPVYQTAPWGYSNQPDYLNQVIEAETDLEPLVLLNYLKKIERKLGRKPTFRYGPRVIDMDILLFDDLVMDTSELVIPHPRMHERDFVLIPLSDLAPDKIHPVLRKTVAELKDQVGRGQVEIYTE